MFIKALMVSGLRRPCRSAEGHTDAQHLPRYYSVCCPCISVLCLAHIYRALGVGLSACVKAIHKPWHRLAAEQSPALEIAKLCGQIRWAGELSPSRGVLLDEVHRHPFGKHTWHSAVRAVPPHCLAKQRK